MQYSFVLVPLAVLTHNPVVVEEVSCGGECISISIETATAYAVGGSPLDLALALKLASRLSVALGARAGLLAFTHPVPDPLARRINFSGVAYGSIHAAISRRFGLILGYAHHHLSNGGTADVNPGLRTETILVGITRHIGPR